MIDPKILNILKSNSLDPSYSIVINSFEQPEFCNRDELQIIVQQVNPNLFNIIAKKDNIIQTLKSLLNENNIEIPDQNDISINNIVQKTLAIDSVLNYDQTSDMFTSGLTGRIVSESNQNTPSQGLSGVIKNKRVTFTSKDYPNIFDNNKFTVEKDKIIIDVNEDIDTIEVKIEHDDLGVVYDTFSATISFDPFYVTEVIDGKIIIDINEIRDNVIPTDLIAEIDANIQDIDGQIAGLSTESSNYETQMNALTIQRNTYVGQKQAILSKIQSLTFSARQPFYIDINYSYTNDLASKQIECVNFELSEKIHFDFVQKYSSVPGLIITIDKNNKIYSSYDVTFDTDEDGAYVGASIKFNNLKKIRKTIDVNVLIIGDAIA